MGFGAHAGPSLLRQAALISSHGARISVAYNILRSPLARAVRIETGYMTAYDLGDKVTARKSGAD